MLKRIAKTPDKPVSDGPIPLRTASWDVDEMCAINPGGGDCVLGAWVSNWLAEVFNNWADWICLYALELLSNTK